MCNTTEFLPYSIPFPAVKLKKLLAQAANDIITILTQPNQPTTSTL